MIIKFKLKIVLQSPLYAKGGLFSESAIRFSNFQISYSEVPNRRADRNKRAGLEKNATLLAYLLSKSINEQGGMKI